MVTILKKEKGNICDIVSEKEICIGDDLIVGITKEGHQITASVINIHEQRKERGIYKDEGKRRMWAKISYQ